MEQSISPTDMHPEQDMYEKFSEDDLNYEDKANLEDLRWAAQVRWGQSHFLFRTCSWAFPRQTGPPLPDFSRYRHRVIRGLTLRSRSSISAAFPTGRCRHYPSENVSSRFSTSFARLSDDFELFSDEVLFNRILERLPPTMDWKFPSFVQDEEEQPEEKEEEIPAQEPIKTSGSGARRVSCRSS
jgi:hypothetical protein